MAKRVRRVRRKARKKETSEPARVKPASAEERPMPNEVNLDRPDDDDLSQEYAYVMQDLRRVFILATLLFALLIALNLFLG